MGLDLVLVLAVRSVVLAATATAAAATASATSATSSPTASTVGGAELGLAGDLGEGHEGAGKVLRGGALLGGVLPLVLLVPLSLSLPFRLAAVAVSTGAGGLHSLDRRALLALSLTLTLTFATGWGSATGGATSWLPGRSLFRPAEDEGMARPGRLLLGKERTASWKWLLPLTLTRVGLRSGHTWTIFQSLSSKRWLRS